MSGLITGYTAGEWDGMADRAEESAAELKRQADLYRHCALEYRFRAALERTEARKRCKHPHKTRSQREFSDDSYSQWTESVLACEDCGEWWRDRPGMSVEENDE